ncbi:hypothetical protein BTA51_01950 [Hahella sp. CCB-MM4]|uniref:hypothetical protein n=1 Tax=Hahella sp. (strain CCB-MM4) TaxID=1926491 RepID=UPI000B9C6A85|nr:hypothetical protein [Hahella sp. CCB-MM4]OZG75172.1 hypothetical protein BTA51_01950 [Hahella sp. CCB-MM4]
MKQPPLPLLISLLLTPLWLIPNPSYAFEKVLQEQVDQENWRATERILLGAERDCQQTSDVNNCLDKVRFSRAWTYTRHAEKDKDHRESFLQRAREEYLAILERHPQHLATIDNLILTLEQLEDRQQLERLLRLLQRLDDRSRMAKVAQMIAGLYLDEGNSQRAFSYYYRSYELEPGQRTLNGLISSFRQSPNEEVAKRLEVLAETTENVSIRRQLYEAILSSRNKVSPQQWENAAINWVAWLGKERALTSSVIEQTIDLRLNPEFRELVARLREPFLGLTPEEVRIGDLTLLEYRQDGWWNDTLLRTWAFSIAAWSEGHNRLLNNDINGANAIWQAALQFAPPSYTYDSSELKGHWAVSLELLTDLARIQWLYKSRLDPRGETFTRVEQALFFSKAQAYKINDLEAIQRHHSIMGKMYADLGIFSENATGVRSAEFQLTHALRTADLRSSDTGKDDPQPQLAQLLADGYSCQLPSQQTGCRQQTEKAQPLYLRATQDYLKLDAVLPAKRTLQNVKVINPQTESKVLQLKSVIDLRTSLTNDLLIKGEKHPDVVNKRIEIANQWQLMGETDEAKATIDRVLKLETVPIDRAKVYQQLESGDIKSLKSNTLKLQVIEMPPQ